MGYTRSANFATNARLDAATLRTELARLRSFLNGGLVDGDLQAGVAIFDLPALAQPYKIAHYSFAAEGRTIAAVPSDDAKTVVLGRVRLPTVNSENLPVLLLGLTVTWQVTLSGTGCTAADFTRAEIDFLADASGALNSSRLSAPVNLLTEHDGVAPFATTLVSPETTVTLTDRTSPQLIVGEVTGGSSVILKVVARARKNASVANGRTVTFNRLRGSIAVGIRHV